MNGFALRNYFWLPPLPAWVNGAAFAFAFRNWIAAMLALYIAFALQLDSPVWAWLTAWIVAQPTPGMVLSRGFYRFIGTISGAAFAVIIIANFAQAPELFVLALALLVGGCTIFSNLLTNNRAYATVLTGYTAAIVASDAIAAPDQVFTIALARGAAILVGASCGIVANSIFAPHRAEAATRRKLAELISLAAHRATIPWQMPVEEKLKFGRKLIEDAIALNTLIEYAASESAVFRLQANNARSLLAHIFGLISARRSLDFHLHRCGWPRHEALQIYHGIVLDLLKDTKAKLDAGRLDEQIGEIAAVRRQLALLRPEDDTPDAADVISARLVIDRIDDALEHFGHALEDWRDIVEERWHPEPRRVLNFHRDIRAAWINGLRAFIAVCLTGGFWIASAWPDGPSALIFVSVMLSLFSAFPRPDRVGWAFFLASLPGVPLGLLCKYYVLAAGSGYDYLLTVSLLFLVPLGLVMSNPVLAPSALAFAFVFLNLTGPANPMVYDLAGSINMGLAIELGTFAGSICYVYIFPPDPHAARAYVTYRIRCGLGQLARYNPITGFASWESRMYDRVNRLYDPENPSGTHTDEWFEAGLGALTLGNEILRLRHWLAEETLPAPVRREAGEVMAKLGKILSFPEPAAAAVKHARARLPQLDPGQGQPLRLAWAQVAGAVEEIDVYLDEHPRLLNRAPIP
ncbi:MAG TPA: FUSC family protein [Candidatus Methylacidiphilales bacterium]|nr:FUSC family protein [Candidatus Methylacidiphilales bacterium]